MKTIIFTVTTDLTFDQRMQRICSTLQQNNYDVLLIGRKKRNSLPLKKLAYQQKRFSCIFEKGKFFYLEYNFRLFIYLLFKKTQIVCSVDVDTLLGVFPVSRIKKIQLVHDAHEYFSELPEVVERPTIKKFWLSLEKEYYTQIQYSYTVAESIATTFNKTYKSSFQVIRNVPILRTPIKNSTSEKYIIYSGALNKGRGIEELLEAIVPINIQLVICGKGDMEEQLKQLVVKLGLSQKVQFKGYVEPTQLIEWIDNAWLGYSLLANEGLSYYYSLSNKFFDYIQSEIPQLAPNFPEYENINNKWNVARLMALDVKTITENILTLLEDKHIYNQLVVNTKEAKKELNWEKESLRLLEFYQRIEV